MVLFYTFSLPAQTISIGAKKFTEQSIMGEMLAQYIEENTSLSVERKFNLGGTLVVFTALRRGDIDLYVEYTGTALFSLLKEKAPNKTPEQILHLLRERFKKKWDLQFGLPLGFNNSYSIAIRKDDPRFTKIDKISQLIPLASSLKIGMDHEMKERPDGFIPFLQHYHLPLQENNSLEFEAGLMYLAMKDKKLDLIISYSTDGRLNAFSLRLLKDDKNFFPAYHAIPLFQSSLLTRHPQLKDLLENLDSRIDDDKMQALNYRVDHLKQNIEEVAGDFLQQEGLIPKKDITSSKTADNILDYFWLHKKRFITLVCEHLFLTFSALFMAVLLGVPLGIITNYFNSWESFIFMTTNLLQTIPYLALLGLLIPVFGIGYTPAIITLLLYALLPIVRNTHTGIQEVRKDLVLSGKALGMNSWQILLKIQIPMAMPVIMAGIRTCCATMVGTATLAALVGAGGLGVPIFRGISSLNTMEILFGALPAALMAIILDRILHLLGKKTVSKGLQ